MNQWASDGLLYISIGHRSEFSNTLYFNQQKHLFVFLLNSADPDEMQHFIRVITVWQSTRLEISSIQRVKYLNR